jgi:hypothetical protein
MRVRSALLPFLAIALGATSAYCDDLDALDSSRATDASAMKSHTPAKKSKHAVGDRTPASMGQIQFSQPNAPPLGAQRTSISPGPPTSSGVAPNEPKGGVSLDLKWRATNDRVDPYDAVRHSSGPNGPGDAVEGGVKLGF